MGKHNADKIALITGASRGIGAAVATALATDCATILLVGRSQSRLQQAASSVEAVGCSAIAFSTDLESPEAIAQLISEVTGTVSRLDILVNNAGIAESAPLVETSIAAWDRHMAVNARAPFLLSTGLLPLLRRSNDPVIVNIGSVVSHKGYEGQGAYTASKHALLGLNKVLARELHEEGARVHFVAPGGVATDMVGKMRPDLDTSVLISPGEVAETVRFLTRMDGNAAVDEIQLRRRKSAPWK